MKKPSKHLKPHELAPHITALFCTVPHTDMGPVKIAMSYAIDVLLAKKPTELDLTDPDNGISFALEIGKGPYPENVKTAALLLRMCLHAMERGHTIDRERSFIPQLLAGTAGYVLDSTARASRQPRPNRRNEDALDRGLNEALQFNSDQNSTQLAQWLEDNGVIIRWDAEEVTFTDGNSSETIKFRTFLNRITTAKKRRNGTFHA